MPWYRRGGRAYYYRTVRIGSRARGVYVGTGAVAEAAAAEVEKRKAERRAHRAALASSSEQYERAIAPLLELDGRCDEILHAAMAAAGYYHHCRGEWRKRKGGR